MSCPSTLQVYKHTRNYTLVHHHLIPHTWPIKPYPILIPILFLYPRIPLYPSFFHCLLFVVPLPLSSLLSVFPPLSSLFPYACTSPTFVFPVAGNIVEEPDIHLILEYSSGAKWGQYTARRANRYVINKHLVYILRILRDHKRWTVHVSVFKWTGFNDCCE